MGIDILSPMIIGTIGVALLLAAFALNLLDRISEQGRAYLSMNFAGAMMAAWYAFDNGLFPFVVLEMVWALVALVKLLLPKKKGSRETREP